MTQQALRELVAKWRRELREVDSDRDNYSPPSADYFASELESLLGEQREAQTPGYVPPLYPQPRPGESVTVTEEAPPLAESVGDVEAKIDVSLQDMSDSMGCFDHGEFEKAKAIMRKYFSVRMDVEAAADEIITRERERTPILYKSEVIAIIRRHMQQGE